MELDSEAFKAAVAAEARGEAPEALSKWLRQPENLVRWRDALAALTADVQAQFTERNAEFEDARAEIYLDKSPGGEAERQRKVRALKTELKLWHGSASRFRLSVNEHLRESKRLISEGHQEHFDHATRFKQQRDGLADAIKYLIEHHLQGDDEGIAFANKALSKGESNGK